MHLNLLLPFVIAPSSNQLTQKMPIFFRRGRIVAPVVIIGTICLAWAYVSRRKKDGGNGTHELRSRSMSMGALQGGRLALQRMVDYHEARDQGVSNLHLALTDLKTILAHQHPDFNQLQSVVAKLEMSGKEDEAVAVLEEERLEALNDGKWHEVYEIEMLLVELLIYKGDFQKAFECKCLGDEGISTDARRPLFKAILHMLLEHPKEAKECWEEFAEIQTQFQMPSFASSSFSSPEQVGSTSTDKLLSSFNEFQKAVHLLKRHINEAANIKRNKS